MPKTKTQKIESVKKGGELTENSQTVILADFSGLKVNDLNKFRKTLKAKGAVFSVIKKRLLKIIFEKAGLAFDRNQFTGQISVVFSPTDVVETAGEVYRFAKQNEVFKILGGWDLKEKKFIEAAEIIQIGQLPSREILLAQLVGMIAAPIKKLLFALNAVAKRSS